VEGRDQGEAAAWSLNERKLARMKANVQRIALYALTVVGTPALPANTALPAPEPRATLFARKVKRGGPPWRGNGNRIMHASHCHTSPPVL